MTGVYLDMKLDEFVLACKHPEINKQVIIDSLASIKTAIQLLSAQAELRHLSEHELKMAGECIDKGQHQQVVMLVLIG